MADRDPNKVLANVEKSEVAVKVAEEPLERVEKEEPPPGVNGSSIVMHTLFFAMVATGVATLHDCPAQPLVPIFLIVAGINGALAKFFSKSWHTWTFYLFVVLTSIYAIWTMVGTYWVYSVYQPTYDEPKLPDYCNRVAYLMAFWLITVQYTCLIFSVLITFCYVFIRPAFERKPENYF